MRNPGVYLCETGPDLRRPKESDAYSCFHCQRVVLVKPFAEPEGFCTDCMKPICNECVAKQECTPFIRKIEKEEAKAAAFRGWF